MANRLPLDFSISFYVGAIIRNKKGDEPSHTLTICIYSMFLYLCTILFYFTGSPFVRKRSKSDGNFEDIMPFHGVDDGDAC